MNNSIKKFTVYLRNEQVQIAREGGNNKFHGLLLALLFVADGILQAYFPRLVRAG